MLKEFKIKIPDEFFVFWQSERDLSRRILFLMAIDFLRQKKISKGKAAEFLGINIHEMLDLMAQYGIPAVNYSVEDLKKEWAIWEKVKSKAS